MPTSDSILSIKLPGAFLFFWGGREWSCFREYIFGEIISWDLPSGACFGGLDFLWGGGIFWGLSFGGLILRTYLRGLVLGGLALGN